MKQMVSAVVREVHNSGSILSLKMWAAQTLKEAEFVTATLQILIFV